MEAKLLSGKQSRQNNILRLLFLGVLAFLTSTFILVGEVSPTNSATILATPNDAPKQQALNYSICLIPFSDVPQGSTFYTFVQCLACRGILGGYSDGTFRPNNPVTRSQLSKIVSNSAGFNDAPGPQLFEDVQPGSTFYDYIQRLANRGIISGYPCGGSGEPCGPTNLPYFRPGNNATRGQISKIVARARGYEDNQTSRTFQDVLVGSTFHKWIENLTTRSIMSGYPCGGMGEPCGAGNLPYFRPNNNATRGQVAKIVSNTFFPNCDLVGSPTPTINPAITPQRQATLMGRVQTRSGSPLQGVAVSVLDYPEYGQAQTGTDGEFSLAVNGGGLLTIQYLKEGYLPIQRKAQAPWQDYEWLPDVVLTPLDANVTTIDLSSNVPFQVARGSTISDANGIRRSTLLFQAGTSAYITLPNGTRRDLPVLHVRSTEYTIGESGPEAMPGDLPAASGYTYSPEFSVDEAIAAGAEETHFTRPVISYLENFLGFPIGGIVPMGYYDRERSVWVASANGVVIKILSITGGMADLDTDGDGVVDNGVAIGITNAERQTLATLYQSGQSLWRVPVTHFSPWDCNWPYGPPPDAVAPRLPAPQKPDVDCQNQLNGSIIGCENQTLGEDIPIVGTDFSLHYESDRAPGRKANYTLQVTLSGITVPVSLKRIELEVAVAGQRYTNDFPGQANQSYTYTWDGKDAQGNVVQGAQPVTVRTGYVYDAVYLEPSQFAQAFGAYSGSGVVITGDRDRGEITISQVWEGSLGAWDAKSQALGGWTLSAQHSFDARNNIIYLGGGRKQSAQSINNVISTIAGNGTEGFGGDGGPALQAKIYRPHSIAVGADNILYIADTNNNRIRRVGTDGIISTVAGNGYSGFSGDGGPATQARLKQPKGIAIGTDGSLYIADTENYRIRRVGTDGIISTIAGGFGGFHGDGGPATQAGLGLPDSVAVAPDGSFYIADTYNKRIRRVGADGIISTVAGNGEYIGSGGDGGPATQAILPFPHSVAIGPDGSLYIESGGFSPTEWYGRRIRRVGPDGIISTVAGIGDPGYSGDGGPATQAQLISPEGVFVDLDGSFFIADIYNHRIRRVGSDGIITTVAGTGNYGFSGDGGPATQASLNGPYGVAVGPDGRLYIADTWNNRIRRVGQASFTSPMGMAGKYHAMDVNAHVQLSGANGYTISPDDAIVPSDDGTQVYIFNSSGKHLTTLEALTGTPLYTFAYDSAGRLTSITDGDNNVTTIERAANGNPTVIVAPFGQRTTLSLNANGYLSSITNPAGEPVQLRYATGGMLTRMTDPKGGAHEYTYDTLGRLVRDSDPANGVQTLSRIESADAYTITVTTAMSRTNIYSVRSLTTGDSERISIDSSGLRTTSLARTNGSTTTNYPDGTVATTVLGPDPRWGMLAPVTTFFSQTLPGGLTQVITASRTISLSNPNDPFSIVAITDTTTINGQVFTSRYDGASRTITGRTAAGRQSTSTLDARGRIVQVAVADLDPVAYTYDSRGRLIQISSGTGANTRTITIAYNSSGYIGTLTDPLGRQTRFTYDLAGRVLTRLGADGQQVSFSYDDNSNVTGVRPPGRPDHVFTYTPADLVADYVPPDVGIGNTLTHYTYNLDKQIMGVTLPDGSALGFGYDGAGRLTTLSSSQRNVSFTYSATTGNLTNVTASDGSALAYGYNGNLLNSITSTGPIPGSVQYTFNNNFQIASQSVNGANTIAYSYDQDSLLTQAGALTISRSPLNGLVTGSVLGAMTDTLVYNSFAEAVDYAAAYNHSALYSTHFTRDMLGRIVQATETIEGVTHTYSYAYDLAGRLISVNKDSVRVSTYAYDANGNRTAYTDTVGVTLGTYDNQDRLMAYGSYTYGYTNNGDLTRKTNTSNNQTTYYRYDQIGNLTAVTMTTGIRLDYVVDGQNRRIGKKVNGTLMQGFLYQNQISPVAELDSGGALVSRFVYAGNSNVPVYMIKGGVTYRIVTDQLGSPRLVVNVANGAVAQRIDYDAFGKVLMDTNPGFQPFGFAGGIYDRDTKLVRFGARDYDAETGRWTAKDPIGFAGSPNLYAYVDNDPINWIDPLGFIPFPPHPSQLPTEWKRNYTHKDPNGERYTNPNGDYVDFHPGRPGETGWKGWDHYHYNGGKEHFEPGTEMPERPSVCRSAHSPASNSNPNAESRAASSSAPIRYPLLRLSPLGLFLSIVFSPTEAY
jgi:RHS repeat-associated protein